MSIVLSNPSQQTINALRTGLRDLGHSVPDVSTLRGQHVFTIGLDQLTQGATLADARAIGWHFQLGDGRDASLAEVSEAGPTPPMLTRVATGDRVAQAAGARSGLEDLDKLRTARYELRVLRISGLRTEAFWLAGQNGAADYIFPYATMAPGVEPRLFAAQEFLAVAARLAQRQMRYDEPIQNPPAQR